MTTYMQGSVMEAETKKERSVYWWFFYSCLLIVGTIAGLSYINHYYSQLVNNLEQQHKSIQQEITEKEKNIAQLKQYTRQTEYSKKILKKLLHYQRDGISLINNVLTDIARVILPDMYLTTIEATTKQVMHCKGYTTNAHAVLNFLENLCQLPYISDGKIIHLKSNNDNNSMIEFSIHIVIMPDKEGNHGQDKKVTIT